jgi:hypothetical protein
MPGKPALDVASTKKVAGANGGIRLALRRVLD